MADQSQKHWVFVFNWLTMGGAERQGLLMAEELVRRGNQVSVVGFSAPGAVQERCAELGIPCYFWPFSFAGSKLDKLRNLFAIARELRSLNPDYLAPYGMIPNIVCGLFWRYCGARSSVWQQRDEGRARQARLLEWLAIRLTPAFISNSDHAVNWLVGQLGVPRKKVRVIRNGVGSEWEEVHKWRKTRSLLTDIVKAEPSAKKRIVGGTQAQSAQSSAADRELSERKREEDSNTLLVTMIANIHSYKDHDTLIRAWKIVIDRYRHPENLKLIFAGNKQDTWSEIESYIRKNQLESYVDAIGSISNVSELIAESTLIVHSSANEGVPNGILEGMSLGKPIVGSDIPGIRETGIGGHPHQLFELGNAESCAEQILYFLTHENERIEAGLMNRGIIERDFGVGRMVDETVAVFESVG